MARQYRNSRKREFYRGQAPSDKVNRLFGDLSPWPPSLIKGRGECR